MARSLLPLLRGVSVAYLHIVSLSLNAQGIGLDNGSFCSVASEFVLSLQVCFLITIKPNHRHESLYLLKPLHLF